MDTNSVTQVDQNEMKGTIKTAKEGKSYISLCSFIGYERSKFFSRALRCEYRLYKVST